MTIFKVALNCAYIDTSSEGGHGEECQRAPEASFESTNNLLLCWETTIQFPAAAPRLTRDLDVKKTENLCSCYRFPKACEGSSY